ncbi:hypothetical protein [Aliidiomarina soli]|uniref:Uncharacterized protein n=1 Tax=Aliidiomarina soli TaxID=1928574 RepID=A0A432WE46_9GAMM|nr:hypothetical protein [Aliidiomarina soli]RUO31154.1 hypothetical protein CWE14_11710 [Aliidiomarina soli]
MISANDKMVDAISSIEFDIVKLPKKLNRIIAKGFVIKFECVFLRALYAMGRVGREDFPDGTGYECFVNHIHMDDYVDSDFLLYSLNFVDTLLSVWRDFDKENIIRAIISCDDYGAVVRFHLLRDNEAWLSDDLEGFIQPVLYIDSCHSVEELISFCRRRAGDSN